MCGEVLCWNWIFHRDLKRPCVHPQDQRMNNKVFWFLLFMRWKLVLRSEFLKESWTVCVHVSIAQEKQVIKLILPNRMTRQFVDVPASQTLGQIASAIQISKRCCSQILDVSISQVVSLTLNIQATPCTITSTNRRWRSFLSNVLPVQTEWIRSKPRLCLQTPHQCLLSFHASVYWPVDFKAEFFDRISDVGSVGRHKFCTRNDRAIRGEIEP